MDTFVNLIIFIYSIKQFVSIRSNMQSSREHDFDIINPSWIILSGINIFQVDCFIQVLPLLPDYKELETSCIYHMKLCLFTINFILILLCVQRFIYISLVLHLLVYGLLVQILLYFTRSLYLCLLHLSDLAIHFFVYTFQQTFFHDPLSHLLYQLLLCMYNIIDVNFLIGSILFHT